MDGWMDLFIYFSFLFVCESHEAPLKTWFYLHNDKDLESLAH